MSGPAEIHVTGSRDIFEADSCTVEYGAAHARGRWRTRWGPNNRRVSYSEPVERTWPIHCVEIHWTQVQAAA